MSILSLSLSHVSSSIELLGRVAMDVDQQQKLLQALVGSDIIDEALVVSTCNRTEVYAEVTRFHAGLDDVTRTLSEVTQVPTGELTAQCKVFYDEAAVGHLFSVASGLDSMVIGESQILGQVRTALATGQAAGTVGSVLNSLIQQGLRVGKRVQTETGIGGAGRSLVTASLDALSQHGIGVTDRQVVVVGAGSMASLAARTAASRGARVTCVNRTFAKAEWLAGEIGGVARPLDELPLALREADIVITCTGARDLVLASEDLGPRTRAVVDLALPHDVDPAVGERLPLVNLVTLKERAAEDDATLAEINAARSAVAGEVRDFIGLRRAAEVRPTVVALRRMGEQVVDAEMARLRRRTPGLTEDERAEVQATVHRVVDKLLHAPTVRVQRYAGDESLDYAAALRDLFAIDQQQIDAVSRAGDL